jgi:hypothetical protein
MAVDATMPTTVVSAPGTGTAIEQQHRFDRDDGDRG